MTEAYHADGTKTRGHPKPRIKCRCGCGCARCPTCGQEYAHGTTSRCLRPECRIVNEPVDCKQCGLAVADPSSDTMQPDGVLTLGGDLVPYIKEIT